MTRRRAVEEKDRWLLLIWLFRRWHDVLLLSPSRRGGIGLGLGALLKWMTHVLAHNSITTSIIAVSSVGKLNLHLLRLLVVHHHRLFLLLEGEKGTGSA